MKKTQFSKFLSVLLCTLLIAAMAVMCIGCASTEKAVETTETTTVAAADDTAADTTLAAVEVIDADGNVLVGQGNTQFTFKVTFADGSEKTYLVSTDETTVGAALLGVDLIAGEDTDYGLYVKDVCGETHDNDVDGTYWSFYIDGEYAMTGVDSTNITAGATYSFAVEG